MYLKDKATLDPKGDPRRRLTNRLRKYRESFSKRGKPVPDIVATVMKPTYGGKLEPKENITTLCDTRCVVITTSVMRQQV